MQDFLNTIALICASVAALALGVILAYGLCQAGFAALRTHARSAAPEVPKAKAEAASAS